MGVQTLGPACCLPPMAGNYADAETGLTLLTNRFYDPRMGRFLARDPAGYAARSNLYTYCNNDPTDLADPLGLSPDAWVGLPPGDLSMRSGHPGMQAGTYQSALAVGMTQGLEQTLVNAALAPVGEVGALGEGLDAEEAAAAAGEGAAEVETAEGLPPVIIGESMRRVRAMADMVGGEVYDAGHYLDLATRDDPISMAQNQQWLETLMRMGRTIIDIGRDPRRPNSPSEFYNMEKDVSAYYDRLTFLPQP